MTDRSFIRVEKRKVIETTGNGVRNYCLSPWLLDWTTDGEGCGHDSSRTSLSDEKVGNISPVHGPPGSSGKKSSFRMDESDSRVIQINQIRSNRLQGVEY